MIRVGIAGLGFMGRVHLKHYLADRRVSVTAVADPNQECLGREARGNFDASVAQADLDRLTLYPGLEEMLADDTIDAVSICSPTREHVDMTIAALEAGKHVLVEKPLGLTYQDARRACDETAKRPELIAMPAMCMRFWPEWRWLRETIADQRFGAVRSITFTRMGSMPDWSEFYKDAELSGSAILDLHIHDADFVRYCFGDPIAVASIGYRETTEGIDHVVTHYQFENGPAIAVAEGGWTMKPGFEFTMRYLVNFDRATVMFNLQSNPTLRIDSIGAAAETPVFPSTDGWAEEIAYFVDCIEAATTPSVVTMKDGAEAVRLVEAERTSIATGQPVPFAREPIA